MKKAYLTIAVAITVATVAVAAAVIVIELGLAFQSETDSGGTVKTGNYIEAFGPNGSMVAISPVKYIQSEDKETYDLSKTDIINRGYMNIGTKDDQVKSFEAIVTFQEQGTWLLMETMDLTLQREVDFVIMVLNSVSLEGTKVITISSTGAHINNNSTISGSWKAWGVGEEVVDYVVAEHESDINRGFIVLVDSSYHLTHHLNVLKVITASSVRLDTKADIVSEIDFEYMTWKMWDSETDISSPALISSGDISTQLDKEIVRSIYNAANRVVAGEPTIKADVYTGRYNFTIATSYKPQIRIDPTDFHDENMKSNVVFLLSEPVA